MPIAPPVSRVMSLRAEPTPALCDGSELTMACVAVGMVTASPMPRTRRPTAASQ